MVLKFLVSQSIQSEKYFTKEVLGKIDEYAKRKIYGSDE